jgi:hypothetical protein
MTIKWKKVVGWPASNVLYYLGHWVSFPMNWCEQCGRLYPIYNTLMQWSFRIDEWADTNIWSVVIEEDDDE